MAARKTPSRPAARRNTFRPRLELLENRVAPAGSNVAALAAGGPAVAYDPAGGVLSLLGGPDGAAVRVGAAADGTVRVNGQSLAGVSPASLRQIALFGGPADSLTLDGLTASGDLAVHSDGAVTFAGDVSAAGRLAVTAASLDVQGAARAAALDLAVTGLLDVEATGSLLAQDGGAITAAADYFVNVGQVRADGARGGSVSVSVRDELNAGTVSAAGSTGPGGRVRVAFTESYIDTTTALTSASGAGGAGGAVSVSGGSGGRLFSSGRFTATGTAGGSVDLFGRDVVLMSATADASGGTGPAASQARSRVGSVRGSRVGPAMRWSLPR